MKAISISILLVLVACNSSDKKIKTLLAQKDSLEKELIDSNRVYMQWNADLKNDSSKGVRHYDSLSAFYFEDLQLVQQYKDSIQMEQMEYNEKLNRLRSSQMLMEENLQKQKEKVMKEVEELGK